MTKSKFILEKAFINTKRYMELPVKSQIMYIHFNAEADDDGIVDAYSILQKLRVDEQDLKNLVNGGFIEILDEEEQIIFISDWLKHNSNADIRWHKQSEYLSLLARENPSALVAVKVMNDRKYKKVIMTAKDALEWHQAKGQAETAFLNSREKHMRTREELKRTHEFLTYNITEHNPTELNKIENNNKTNKLDGIKDLDNKLALFKGTNIDEKYIFMFCKQYSFEELKKYFNYVSQQKDIKDKDAYLISAFKERWLDENN